MDLNFVKMACHQKLGSRKVKSYSKRNLGTDKKTWRGGGLKKQIAHKKQNPEVCLRRDDRVLQNKFTQLILICNNTQKKKRQTII